MASATLLFLPAAAPRVTLGAAWPPPLPLPQSEDDEVEEAEEEGERARQLSIPPSLPFLGCYSVVL